MREQLETEIAIYEIYKAETRLTNCLFLVVMLCFAGYCFASYWRGGHFLFAIGGGFVAIVVLTHLAFRGFLRAEQNSRFRMLDDLNQGRRV